MSSTTMTVRLTDDMKLRLEELAKSTHRTKSFLAAEAINEYLSHQEWQISEIKKGLIEAEAGELLDHSAIRQYWEMKHANQMDSGRKA